MALPELKPYLSTGRVVPEIKLLSRLHVKLPNKFSQNARLRRRGSNEVIMIGEYRPGTQLPRKFVRVIEQRFLHEVQPLWGIQMRQFPISPRGDDVKARRKQPMCWRVGPVHLRVTT